MLRYVCKILSEGLCGSSMKDEAVLKTQNRKTEKGGLIKELLAYRLIYMMAVPGLLYYIIFCYAPMYGAIIAFKDYSPARGVFLSQWVGLKHFYKFFESVYFQRVFINTLILSVYDIAVGFPAPIILALLLNEVRVKRFKKAVQTITYIPNFVSIVVISGMIVDFSTQNGIINQVLSIFGFEKTNLLLRPELFKSIYVWSGVWQSVGWGSIVYLAALGVIDPQLYEAATLDGANRFKQTIHVTLPGIAPTIIVLFILRMGNMMSVGFEKVILLYNPSTYETADVISSYVYRKGLVDMSFSFSTAVGLFNSVINLVMLITANAISRKLNDTSLW